MKLTSASSVYFQSCAYTESSRLNTYFISLAVNQFHKMHMNNKNIESCGSCYKIETDTLEIYSTCQKKVKFIFCSI